ncbi:MAG: 2-succinyl-5-enolpyruvyl-6-hydroxy-3-cyclohexene-1-carboxylic-acid synthase [Halobacteriaceae archaeon]
MTAPNTATLWGETIADELAAAGVDAVCVAPGSRSTPLTMAVAAHEEIRVYSHLDERSAAYFALGRAKRTGRPTPLVCTSGTAAANFHPAVMEADEARVPMLLLTADRPPELHDSGANQTADQTKLYGDSVRSFRSLPEPEADARKLRSLRTTVARAVATATGTPPGPVHLNVPLRKPLEPTPVEGSIPEDVADRAPEAVEGRDGPFVSVDSGAPAPPEPAVTDVVAALDAADRPLVVCGPADAPTPGTDSLVALADATDAPVLADPLSGHRFGPVDACGGYDAYLDGRVTERWPDPDAVVRFGASPTSKPLRRYLARTGARQFLVDPAGGWREAEFRATDLVTADESAFARAVAERVDSAGVSAWRERFREAERTHWRLAADADPAMEGSLLAAVADRTPDPATVFVSNSMPVRDLDRFGAPRDADVRVFGNRGVSGIDGITSTALGAGSATADPLVLVTGDLAYYHDMNGLLALGRCDVDATIVLVNNDGGGIFHMLPVEEFDPPFTEQFRTPHGLDFDPTADLYDLDFERVAPADFPTRFEAVVGDGTTVLEVETDAEASHRAREALQDRLVDALADE